MKDLISNIVSHPYFTPAFVIFGALIATSGLYLGVAAPLRLPPFPPPPPKPALTNTEILLDRSASMEDPFPGGPTKLAAAIVLINEYLGPSTVADTDNLALRQFGGSCEGQDSGKIIVEWGLAKDRREEIADQLKTITAEGETTLVSGVVQGTGDFSDVERFGERGDRNNSIVVFYGGGDCQDRNQTPIEAIEERLRNTKITPKFFGVGLDVTDGEEDELESMFDALGGTFENATNMEELSSVVAVAFARARGVGTLTLVLRADRPFGIGFGYGYGFGADARDDVIEILRDRVASFGISPDEIEPQGRYQIFMRLPQVPVVKKDDLVRIISEAELPISFSVDSSFE